MNALQTFFGVETYRVMGDEAVLKSHPMHCVERPPGWLGGGEISDWLNEHVGVSNHCWLSADDRGSHLFFMTPAQAQQFREYLARREEQTQEKVIALAKRTVFGLRPTQSSYRNVGDVLVSYLCEEIDGGAAVDQLNELAQFYQCERDREGLGTHG